MKSKLKKLTSDSFVYGLSNTLGKFIGVFLIPIYTRVFTPSDYGVIDLVQLSIAVMIILLTLGLDSAIFRFFYDTEDKVEQKTIVSTIILFAIISGATICLFGVLFAKQISLLMFNTSSYYLVIVVGLIQIPVSLVSGFIFRVLRLEFKAKWYAGVSVFGLIVIIVLTIYLVVFLKTGIIGVFIARIAGELIQASIGFIVSRSNYCFSINFNKLLELLKFGIPLVPAGLSQWSLVYINRYILLFFTNLDLVGIYAVGYKVSSIMMIITGAFQLAWSPFAFSILNDPNVKEIYARVFKYFLIVTISIAAFMTTYAREIILIVATPEYLESYSLIGILTVCIAAIGSYYILCIGSTIEKRTINITISLLIGTFFNVLLGFILIPYLGIIGCALAMLFGYLSACIIVYKYSQQCYYIPYDLKSTFILTISYTILYLLSLSFSEILNPIKIIASLLFYITIYFCILDNKEKETIFKTLNKIKIKI
ncbi:MAG: oligosaccharide flippase family protein [Cyanobacteriota bacterium]